jgi:hypothetical protein
MRPRFALSETKNVLGMTIHGLLNHAEILKNFALRAEPTTEILLKFFSMPIEQFN